MTRPRAATDDADMPGAAWWRALRRDLLRWYRRSYRRLPWRAEPGMRGEPYHVLVSETMLQQTQVATVVEYFQRFIERFPSVKALADADEQEVLHTWQGLGYYRRARHLHRAAQRIVEQHGGAVPETLEGLRELPGVGRYTAGAIASIAFARPAPIVDGNVARVFARLLAIDEPVDAARTHRRLWSLADRLVARARQPGDLNQAMMELGATICTPVGPRCPMCPLRSRCRGLATGRTEALPIKAARTRQTKVTHEIIAVEKQGRLLVDQRPDTGLWSGMWQLVTRDDGDGDDLASWIAERFGLTVAGLTVIGAFEHMTTHRRITFRLHRTHVTGGRLRRGSGRWVRPAAMQSLAMSNAQRRAAARLTQA